jgi:uncharacterized protein YodC (DUF2158 family)
MKAKPVALPQGSVVRLASGGPNMTVSYGPTEHNRYCLMWWDEGSNDYKEGWFKGELLVTVSEPSVPFDDDLSVMGGPK